MTAFERAVANISDTPVRDMYARLAGAHEAGPTVPDLGGGVPGDRYSLTDTPLSPDETADLEREEEPTEPAEGPGRVRPVYEDDAELGGEG